MHRGPFIKTLLVNIVPACCSTPDDFLLVGLELHETDGTFAVDGFSLASG